MTAASKAVMEYAGRRGLDFSLLRKHDTLQILTRRLDLEKLTQNFTSTSDILALTSLDLVQWGVGTGVNIFQAKRNAANAVNIAKHTDGVYYISAEGTVTGPIGNNSPVYELEPSDELLLLSAAFHIDHANMQKILAYSKLSNSAAVTAGGGAEFLGVTTRSARRLLKKILDGGGASFYEETAGGRGRPQKHYKLLFANSVNPL